MIIDKVILDELTKRAQNTPRLRMVLDLRDTQDDDSQRIINAIEPGTELPIHRHCKSCETAICIRGHYEEYFYDEKGNITEIIDMRPGGIVLNVPIGQWHNIRSLESGTILFECKNGKYEPCAPEDILINEK